jgi:hypothetical protein
MDLIGRERRRTRLKLDRHASVATLVFLIALW